MDEDFKRLAARAAMAELEKPKDGVWRIGLGTGSTAKHFVDLLGARVAEGFECICVPTSEQTAAQARSLNIPLSDLDHLDYLDITVDGTDEIAPDLSLIKGGGGALLREKIVAASSRRMVVIADSSKIVEALGAFALPVEVNVFGLSATRKAVERVLDGFEHGQGLSVRAGPDGDPFVTDGGHLIIDARFGRISDAQGLSASLLEIPGVVQHGLFLKLCQAAYIAGPEGVQKLGA